MQVIGRIDKVDFPELDIADIELKVDTGAYTTSIHSHEIKTIEIDGKEHLEFKLLDPSYPQYKDKVFRVKDFKEKTVKSSFGNKERRFVIKTSILIFNKKYAIELSLSERGDMKYPILLGRRFLNKKFLVNTDLKNISFDMKQKNYTAK